MLNLTFAPSADLLVPIAADSIRRAWADPFLPPAVIVPNPDVGKWLRMRLIETAGMECIAGARVLRLERFLWDTLGGGNAKMLTAGHLSQIICALLDDGLLAMDIYKPLRRYLCNDTDGIHNDELLSSPKNKIDALKRVQLSMRIAGQFLEYEYNRPSVWSDNTGGWIRPGIDAQWLRGKPYFDGCVHELWQMDLYRKTYERIPENEYTTLPHLYRKRREECAKERTNWCDVGHNKQVFLFGVSKISHFHRNTLVEISQDNGVDMHVFLTNPCAEFWEDVDTSRRSFAPRRAWKHNSPDTEAGIKPVKPDDYNKEELDLFTDEDNKLLELWGNAGKENIYLWCPMAEWNFEYYSNDMPQSDTLLKSIQRSLLLRQNDLDIPKDGLKDDGSIQILACPDVGREIEELREQILDMAQGGTIKSFGDVAVYIPDPNKYLPHIERVFGAYPPHHPSYIPFTILCAACGASMTAHGLGALLSMIGGQFNRAQIFDLLRNPVVRASKKISSRDVDLWMEWTEKYGMYRGYDKEQRKRMGDMGDAATDEHTFTRGLRKLEIDISNDTARSDIIDDNEIDAVKRSAEKFRALLDELNELAAAFLPMMADDAEQRANTVRPYDMKQTSLSADNNNINIGESVEMIRQAVWSWFGKIPDDGSVNGRAEADVRAETLDGLDSILLEHSHAGREHMPLDEFIAHLRGCVPAETDATRGAWNGVTFAPLRASMALPHRAIFALGLGATDFPGTNEKGNWDLLSGVHADSKTGQTRRRRIVGDSDRVRDNRFAFLELIHAAKERLVLSYRARDMQKDEPLEPSSVLLELEDWLVEQGVVSGDGSGSGECLIRREIPWVIHESIGVAVERGRAHGTWDKTQRELSMVDMQQRVRHRHEIIDHKKSTSNTSNIYTTTDIRDIKLFMRNPLEYHLAKVLKIREDDEGDMSASDEPVSSLYNLACERREIWFAILDILFSSQAQNIDIEELLEDVESEVRRIYGEHVESGLAPEGHAKRAEEEGLVAWAKACAYDALALCQKFPAHRFSKSSTLGDDGEGVVSIDCGEFTITGNLAPCLVPIDPQDKTRRVGIISFLKDGSPKCLHKGKDGGNYELWLDAAARRLYDINDGCARPLSAVLLDYHPNAKCRVACKTIELGGAEKIKAQFATLAAQMLTDGRSEHLPFEVLAKSIDTNTLSSDMVDDGSAETKLDDCLRGLTADAVNEAMSEYKSYTDGFDLTDANFLPVTLTDGELREIAGVRYAPLFMRWIYD